MPVYREVRRRRRRRRLRPQFIAFCAAVGLLLLAMVLLISRCGAGRGEDRPAEAVEALPTVPADYVKSTGDIHSGPLILVDNDHPYTFPEGVELVIALDERTGDYLVRDYSILQEREAFAAYDAMLSDFAGATGLTDVNITSAYRSYEEQEAVFNASAAQNGQDHAERYVMRPGGSEHHTGLAADLSVYDVRTRVSYDFDGRGDYGWIYDHCAEYGIMLSYTADKEFITGIAPESWHFRYVGVPHAACMADKGLCLEEYIQLLREYTVDKPLHYGDYTIYYCPEDALYVPANGGCSVSGNNLDGFIVTVG